MVAFWRINDGGYDVHLYTASHVAAVGTFQSGVSEWDSSESEYVPVARGTSSGVVDAAGSTAVTAKPQLASVTEKTEVGFTVFDNCCFLLETVSEHSSVTYMASKSPNIKKTTKMLSS